MILSLDQIRRDGGTQMRVANDDDTIDQYADDMESGDSFPPVVVFHDGTEYWLADGFHRIAAVQKLATRHPDAAKWAGIDADVKIGTRYDAIRLAIGALAANKTNAVRYKNADKRKAVEAALKHPGMMTMSDRKIADEIGVSHTMVASVRQVASVATCTQPTESITAGTSIMEEMAPKEANTRTGVDGKRYRTKAAKKESPSVSEMTREEKKAKALDLFSSGVTQTQIADALGLPLGTVKHWIDNPDKKTKVIAGSQEPGVDDSMIERLFSEGKLQSEIAAELEVSVGCVKTAMRKLGLGKAGKRAASPLMNHISRADAEALAWTSGIETVTALASVAPADEVNELVSALGRLSKAAATLRNRLNKEAGKGE